MDRPNNFFEVLAGSLGKALTGASEQVIPYAAYREDRTAKQQELIAERYRRERDFVAMQNYRDATLAQGDARIKSDWAQKLMTLQAEEEKNSGWGSFKGSPSELMGAALARGDQQMVDRVTPFWRELNSVENVNKKDPKSTIPPNLIEKLNTSYAARANVWDADEKAWRENKANQIIDTRPNSPTMGQMIPDPSKPYTEPRPTKEGVWKEELVGQIPYYQEAYPGVYDNALDSIPRETGMDPALLGPKPNDGSLSPEGYAEYVRLWNKKYKKQ